MLFTLVQSVHSGTFCIARGSSGGCSTHRVSKNKIPLIKRRMCIQCDMTSTSKTEPSQQNMNRRILAECTMLYDTISSVTC